MATFTIEIKPKKPQFDPLAKQVQATLLENGVPEQEAEVHTERLFRIEGELEPGQIKNIAQKLLVDPIVETARVAAKGKQEKADKGQRLDVWPRAGVTDPVGETVEKGLHDLGFQGKYHAASGTRYLFPKLPKETDLKSLATQYLANELIHDINIHTNNS